MPNSITITDLDKETYESLKAEAKRCGVDVNSFAGGMLKLLLNTAKVHHDLDSLAATWSDNDLEEFRTAVSDFEKVDEGMWK